MLSGQKTFITNGWSADFVLVAAKTDPAAGACGISLPRAEDAAVAKLWATEATKLLDDLVQMHGGYGMVREYRIARAYTDARPNRIFGGASEVMKEIIARAL